MDMATLATIFAFITMSVEGVDRILNLFRPSSAGTPTRKLLLYAVSILLGVIIVIGIPEIVLYMWKSAAIASNPFAVIMTGFFLGMGSKVFYQAADLIDKWRKNTAVSTILKSVEAALKTPPVQVNQVNVNTEPSKGNES